MRIKRVFNNNAVIAYKDSSEVVIFGKGIGFNKKHGDEIDKSKIEKMFFTNEEHSSNFETLFKDISTEYADLTYKIVKQAESDLKINFNSGTYIAILDHINYALIRYKEGLVVANPLKWEIKRTYQKEYETALKTLDIIEEETKIRLSDDEAATIAIHYYNARDTKSNIDNTYKSAQIIQEIIKLIQFYFKIEFDENDINYSRLMTHLTYFINGLLSGERKNSLDEDFLFNQLRLKYVDIYDCVMKIKKLIYSRLKKDVSNEELTYLMIHIHRIIEKENAKKGEL